MSDNKASNSLSGKNKAYSTADKEAVYRVIAERRDMRHFRSDAVDPEVIKQMLIAAHHAPSVGLMQPWRFLRVSDNDLRQQLHQLVDEERAHTAEAMGERKNEFMKLKVEGILDCAEVIVAALPDDREKYVFGRRTLPEMDLASLSCAIQNMWLVARAEGIGMGWVSMFDPQALAQLLKMPANSKPVAILCIGHVDEFYDRPMLVEENWAQERPLEEFIYQNYWPETAEEQGN
ncbi:5,6-dimethylbenzimidazole synthase [Amphritea balenae]|uniref:5,6-dimethylbenzimidazole synthase n=1 Tax=Amphritea balenae TaxID=452629 RepID=A0A3P1SUU6_9GAMM|nr:5,6-dimethylbenzimidazole synthase [Amphritea balenae]RRD00735.1 5,6-dimethylbenzimidazole synthase [Amphritea balenae]GGK68223.1 5,6-dimethylbenzimidazole synthase [Amphritea balenae]